MSAVGCMPILCKVNRRVTTLLRARLTSSRSSAVMMSPTSMKANEGERVRCTSTLLFGIKVPLHDSGKGFWTGHTVSRALLCVGPQRHPTLTLSPSRLGRGVSIIHRTTGLVSCPVRRVVCLILLLDSRSMVGGYLPSIVAPHPSSGVAFSDVERLPGICAGIPDFPRLDRRIMI